MNKNRCIFLGTANSCRSQMAEAIVNGWSHNRWEAFSAGTQPAGVVHPLTLRVLAEIGVLHQGVSKSINHFQKQHFDLVITVCDEAAVNCPVWLGPEKKFHIGFPDLARFNGSEEEQIKAFRKVRNDIFFKVLDTLIVYSLKNDQHDKEEQHE